jgi:thiol-disulfide isomerase/thioredoxin
MSASLSSLDLFRKIPRDLTQATSHGGALSLLVFTVLSAVLLLEVWTYAAGETKSKIVLDQNMESKLQVNFAVSFPELPCRFAQIEAWDYLGNSKLDIGGLVTRTILTGEHGDQARGEHIADAIVHEKAAPGSAAAALKDMNPGKVPSESVTDVHADRFAGLLKEREYTFVLFYANWCMFCRMVLPIWHDLGNAVRSAGLEHRVRIARIDCVEEAALCTDSKIGGYPTFMLFKGIHPLQDDYHSHRNVESFLSYLTGIMGPESAPTGGHPLKYQWHEGCMLKGRLMVNRVPGNFHVMAKSVGHSFDERTSNMSHYIHELSFGPSMPPRIRKRVPLDVRENIDPLSGQHFVNHYGSMSHEHSIKVVSTHYETGTLFGHEKILGYQMSTSNHQYDATPNVPEAKFSYDLSPTAVVISQAGRRWYEFVTSLCAIIGGMFTVASLLSGVVGTVKQKVTGEDRQEILSPSSAKSLPPKNLLTSNTRRSM